MCSHEFRLKASETMRKNGNQSSYKDLFENSLKELNIKYEKQYDKDSRYPFLCDFYLVDLDIFIEINGYWTHNDHFYTGSEDDLKTLSLWKEQLQSGHTQYRSAIDCWTFGDLKKRAIALKNNINYAVLWNLEDIENYIEYLKNLY